MIALDTEIISAVAPNAGPVTDARRRHLAYILCDRAQNHCAWQLADKLARAWELGGCVAIGVPAPTEIEGRR